MKWFRDGDQICVTKDDFVDLQASPAFFIALELPIVQTILESGLDGLPKDTIEQFEFRLALAGFYDAMRPSKRYWAAVKADEEMG